VCWPIGPSKLAGRDFWVGVRCAKERTVLASVWFCWSLLLSLSGDGGNHHQLSNETKGRLSISSLCIACQVVLTWKEIANIIFVYLFQKSGLLLLNLYRQSQYRDGRKKTALLLLDVILFHSISHFLQALHQLY
jgi:hypothetical protein